MDLKSKIPVKVLLADDDKDDRFFFAKALGQLPFATQLTTVNNGALLMAHLTQNAVQLPDVLFLDLNMPRKNGMECPKEIKESESLKKIPVIIYSTSLRQEVVDALYNGGAHYYLYKCEFAVLPVYIEKVIMLVAENLMPPSRDSFLIIEAKQ